MSPIIQCSGKKGKKIEALAFFSFFSLLFHNQPASARIWRYIPNPTDSVDQCHAQKSGFTRVILPKHFVKPYRCPPPRNFPPLVTKFLPKRKTLPSVPRTAHLSTQQKVCNYHVRGTSSKGQKRIVVHCKEKKTPRKIRECASSRWNERLSRLLLPPTVFTLLLRRFVRFTRFFLLLTSPHTPPSSFPPVRVITPPPPSSCPEHPECNSSLCLHCFRALPSSAHQTAELPDCLPRARLVHTEWECESHCSSAELSDRNAAQWPRRDTT